MRCLALSLATFLAGCAGVGNDCATDAFQLGQRDGLFASYEQSARYASACGSFNAARYREGYDDGFARRPTPLGHD